MAAATRPASFVWLLAVSVVIADDHYRARAGCYGHGSPRSCVVQVCGLVGWCDIPGGMRLDRHAVAEVLMVFVVAALPCAEMGEALDELDGLNPLDHLEAQLELVAQPQRSAVQLVERLAVHLVGEDG